MSRSIKLRWASSHYQYHQDDGIRVRFDVECASEMPVKVFAYRMEPVDPYGTAHGFFSHICSPVDLAEYPEDAPTAGQAPEWFRLSYVDIFVRSVREAEDFIQIVKADVRRLVRTLNKMDTIFTNGTELVGETDCDPPQSSSESSTGSTPSSASLGDVESLIAFGTSEQSVGSGVSWISIGTGAGSPIGSSDSLSLNRSKVTLSAGESSKLLLVQGFDFSGLPDDAVIEGIKSRVWLRNATNDPASSSSLGESSDGSPATCPRLMFLTLQHPDLGMGTNLADAECIGGSSWETINHGGEGDLWGFSALSGQLLKDGAFGLGLIVRNELDEEVVIEVDGVELEVFFRDEL